MSGHPQGAQYDDGYGHGQGQQGQNAYYQDEQYAGQYHDDQHAGYQDNQHGDAYYDESYVSPYRSILHQPLTQPQSLL
jgi:1,3-beta-glucan synthase